MTLSLIVAVAHNRVIGVGDRIPWRLPEDMKHFKQTTTGHPIIMGRKTWESFPKRPLPDRTNIVITRNSAFTAEGATLVPSLDEAIETAQQSPGNEETFVIGGAQVYAQALPLVDRMYMTEVDSAFDGDVLFPEYPSAHWHEVSRTQNTSSTGLNYSLVIYERKSLE